jgi:hypothetical protein
MINEDFCSRSRHAKKTTIPVRSPGPTGQAGIYLMFQEFIRYRTLAN